MLILLMQKKSETECKVIFYDVLLPRPGGFNIEIYLNDANALLSTTPHPVLIFFPGFGSTVPSSIYSELLIKTVEQTGDDLIIIALSQDLSLDPNVIAENIKVFFDYISSPTNARQLFLLKYPLVRLDIQNRLGVLSCGAGTPAITIYLNTQCGPVKFLAAMDPTDTFYGLYSGQATNTTLINGRLPFHTPVLIIANALANSAYSIGERVTGACSPYQLGSERFYEVLSGSPVFLVNFTQYGLGDELNKELILPIKSLVCDTCFFHPSFQCNYTQHQDDIASLVSNFMLATLNRNQTNLVVIEQANQYFQNVINKYQLNGYDVTKQGAFCTRAQ